MRNTYRIRVALGAKEKYVVILVILSVARRKMSSRLTQFKEDDDGLP